MGHVAAVAQLDAGLGAFCMHSLREPFEAFPRPFMDIQLAVEGDPAPVYGAVCDRRHPDAAAGYADMVVLQHLAGLVPGAHIFKRGAADGAVAQGHRAELERRK